MKNNRIIIFISIILFISFSIVHATINTSRIIYVGVSSNNQPYSYQDNSSNLKGYNIDVMNEIANVMNLNINYVKIEADKALEKLKSKEIDVYLGIQYNQELIHEIKLSKPIYQNKYNLFMIYENNLIRDIYDLEGKKVSVWKYDPAYKDIKKISGIRLFVTNTLEDAFKLMINGYTDVCIAEKEAGIVYMYNDKIYGGRVKMVGEDIETLPSGIAALKENEDLIVTINKGIDEINKNGELEKINEKWLGKTIIETYKYIQNLQRLYIVLAVGSILIIFFLISLNLNRKLKKEVNARTKKIVAETKFKEGIIDSIFNGLITMDNDLKIRAVNSKVYEITNINVNELINKKFTDTIISKYFDVENIQKVIMKKDKIILEEKKIKINNEIKDIQYSITPVLDDIYEVQGITLIISDITKEKKMIEKIRLKDKMETMGKLTASIAHEIRNPLTSINMYMKLLPEKINNKEFIDNLSKDIPKEIERLNKTLTTLLDYSKPHSDNKEQILIKEEIDFLYRLLSKKIKNENIQFIIELKDNITVYFDRNCFRQIILNILLNAIDAVKEIDNEKKITLKAFQSQHKTYIAINDNGTGINLDDLERIFEPFYTTKNNGHGLGLSIVKSIAEENGAKIRVSSVKGIGTKFTVEINSSFNIDSV